MRITAVQTRAPPVAIENVFVLSVDINSRIFLTVGKVCIHSQRNALGLYEAKYEDTGD